MFRVDLERTLELFERAIRLIHVVVGDPEIRAHIRIAGFEPERLLVPACGIRKAARIEVHIAELDARGGILRVPSGGCLQLHGACFVERNGGLTLLLGRRRRRSRRLGRPRRGLLIAADHPADQEAEKNSGDAEQQ